MFYSRSSRPVSAVCPCGRGFAVQYEERIVDGSLTLVKTGVRDVHEYIQQGKESCDVYNILNRFSNGDIAAIQRVKGFYADVASMPKTLVEAHNFMKSIDTHFAELPAEVKDEFGNSSHKFMKSIENGELNKILSKFVQSEKADRAGITGDVAQKIKEDK